MFVDNLLKMNKPKSKGATTYLTHNFHTYPAKFIPQVPEFSINKFTEVDDIVLDPFVGCGTSLVEAKLLNRRGIGVDLNPIATLLSKVKTTDLEDKDINLVIDRLFEIKDKINNYYNGKTSYENIQIPEFYNRDHWFQKNVQNELTIALSVANKILNIKVKNFIRIAISSIIVKVSNQESDTRFAAINKNISDKYFLSSLEKKITDMLIRIKDFSLQATDSDIHIYQANSEKLNFIESNYVDHIVTSPPYANTYDYYLYHKFRMFWLGYDVKKVQKEEIGSRDKHSSQKKGIDDFLKSINLCMSEFNRVLKPHKYAVIVIGDSIIRGQHYKLDELLKEIASNTNFIFIQEYSYNLQKNTRLFNPKFTNSKKSEHIMIFQNKG